MIADEQRDMIRARYLFRVVRDHTADRLVRKRMETRLAELDKSLDQIDHQLNTDEQCVCPICLGDVIDPVHPDSCNHIFCHKCLCDILEQREQEEQNPRCSICRASFSRIIWLPFETILDSCQIRFDADVNDGVAWYNLALVVHRYHLKFPPPEELDHRQPLKNVLDNVASMEGGGITSALQVAIEAVKRSAVVVPELWLLLSSLLTKSCELRMFVFELQRVEHDFGPELGKMNLRQIVTKALNIAEELRLSPMAMHCCNPWVDVVRLMSHFEYQFDFSLNLFTISVAGKALDHHELVQLATKKASDAYQQAIIRSRIAHIHDMLHMAQEEPPDFRSFCGHYFVDMLHLLPHVDYMGCFFLAKYWRTVPLEYRDRIAEHITQEALWGRAIEGAPNREFKNRFMLSMAEHEEALVGGKLFSKEDISSMFAEHYVW